VKIGITGVSGHIGNVLARELIRQGHQVKGLSYHNPLNLKGLDVVNGDLLDFDSLVRFCQGLDVVYHLAAKISINGDLDGSVMLTNVQGTRNLAKAAIKTGIQKFYPRL